MRILALDIGDKRIGVAISDELGVTARGLSTIERISYKNDTDAVIGIVREHQVACIVAGLPLNLDGSDSVQTVKTREFTKKLADKLRSNGLASVSVELHDERFTTKIAENVLIEADLSRKRRKDIIDKQAAVVILQSWLDSHRTQV